VLSSRSCQAAVAGSKWGSTSGWESTGGAGSQLLTAIIKYSQDAGKGAWKAVEVGAEGTVDARETWQTAQFRLYAEPGQQLKSLWANGNGKHAQGASESHIEAVPAPHPTEDTSPLLPRAPDRVQAAQPGGECLVEPQDG